MGALFPISPTVAPGPTSGRGLTADVGYEAARNGATRPGVGPIPGFDCLMTPGDACASLLPCRAGPPREASGHGLPV